MTEPEWLACENPTLMLRHMETVASDRKMRLFECACARRVWHRVNDERLAGVLLGMEHFADGLLSARELEPLHNLAWEIEQDDDAASASRCIASELGIASRVKGPVKIFMDSGPIHPHGGLFSASLAARGTGGQEEFQLRKKAERKQQTILVRDIFGNPFRPVAFPPEWRTGTAVTLARTMYDTRDFSPMPILADALQDVGCEDEDMLNHCRQPGEHVRGCWVVDLLLARE